MIAIREPVRHKKPIPAWHSDFEAMIPAIERSAKIAFRHLDLEAREEAVQETVCNACQAYLRLVELDKTDVAYASVLARYSISQVRQGRKVGGKLNCHDVLSDYCQRKKNLVVQRADRFDPEEEAWVEILIEHKRAGPAETAIIRLDFVAWLQSLPRQLRRIAVFLANGETTAAAAKRFRVSSSRISQIRKELLLAWHRFQGEEPASAVT